MKTETYGELIARLRSEKGWTQPQLAEESGVPLRTIQDVERDKVAKPQRATRLALHRALGIEGEPQQAREEWPADVRVFLDVMGAFLTALPESRRLDVIHDLTRRIVGAR